MTRFLALVRRLCLGGVAALLACILFLRLSPPSLVSIARGPASPAGLASLFFLASPVVFTLLSVVATQQMRSRGRFARYYREKPWLGVLGRSLKRDVLWPYHVVNGFFRALFEKDVDNCGFLIARFTVLLAFLVLCLAGMGAIQQSVA